LIERQRQESAPALLYELATTVNIAIRSKAFFDNAMKTEETTSAAEEANPIVTELREEWTRRLRHVQEKLSGYETEELHGLSFEDRQVLASDLQVMEKEIRWVVAQELNRRKGEIRAAFYANNGDSPTPANLSKEESDLDEKLVAEARKAKPLKDAVKRWLPLTPEDEKIWDEIEANEPFSRCFSRAITQAEMTDIYISGMNSKLISGANETRANLAKGMQMVLQDCQRDWENKNTEPLKQTIATFMGMMDPSMLKASKTFHSVCAYRKYGLRLVHKMSQEELLGELFHEESRDPSAIRGMCLYATVKHLACKVVGGDYRYEELNTSSSLKKHQAYKKAMSKGASVRKVLDQWTADFTDARKRRYEDGVEWGKREKQSLDTYFSTKPPLDEGEGVLFTFNPTKNGEGIYGHAVDVFSQGKGSPASYFDINLGEYNYEGNNFGRDVQLTIHDEMTLRCETRGVDADGIEMKSYPLKRNQSLEEEVSLATAQPAATSSTHKKNPSWIERAVHAADKNLLQGKMGTPSISGEAELDADDEDRLNKLYGKDEWELATNKQPPGKDIGLYRAINRDWKQDAYLIELKSAGAARVKIRKIGPAHHQGNEIELVNTKDKNWKKDETTWRSGFGKGEKSRKNVFKK